MKKDWPHVVENTPVGVMVREPDLVDSNPAESRVAEFLSDPSDRALALVSGFSSVDPPCPVSLPPSPNVNFFIKMSLSLDSIG